MSTNLLVFTGNWYGTASRQIFLKVSVVYFSLVSCGPAVKLRHDAANTQHAFNLTLECPCVYYTSGLNAAPSQPLPHEVRLLAQPRHESEASKGLTVSAVSVPVLSKHPLGMYIHLTENVNKCCLRSEDTLTDTLRYIYLTSWSMQLFC